MMTVRAMWHWIVGLGLAWTTPAAAQEAVLAGVLLDAATEQPIAGASVRLLDPAGPVPRRATSDPHGLFRLDGLVPGQYAIAVTAIGYAADTVTARTVADQTMVRVLLRRLYILEEVVVTPERSAGSTLGAPTALSVLGRERIEPEVAVGGPVEHLQGVAGVDVAQKGLVQRTFSARGPSGVNSAALLVLTDFRPASLPGLRFNIPYLIALGDEDLDRIEVVRGPGSALYGPDADHGVVHLVTTSPLERQGTALSLTGGGRSLAQASLRHARRFGAIGIRLSGSYLTAEDWSFHDPANAVPPDPRLQRAAGDFRIDWRRGRRTTAVLAGGTADAVRLVDQSEFGAVQLRNWQTSYLQARFDDGRLFGNIYLNLNDAGESILLRGPAPIIDESRTLGAQVQHGAAAGPVDLRYGVEVQRVVPRTGGTLHGSNEGDDNVGLAGGFVAAGMGLTPRLDLLGAVRGDHHDRLHDFVVSPRIAAVYRPGEAHALRITWNHASSTPVAADLFLDFDAGPLAPELPYRLRGAGTARSYTFRRDCGGLGGLCMHSPFEPTGTSLPADATLLWGIVQRHPELGPAVAGVPAPTAADVGTVLALYQQRGDRLAISPDHLAPIPAARRTLTGAVEVGYRGQLRPWLTASVDLARTRLTNLGGSTSIQTPHAFLDSVALADYLHRGGMPEPEARGLAGRISSIPLGVITPAEAKVPTAVLLIPRQDGQARFWSADLELTAAAAPWLSLWGSYSWVSRSLFRRPAGLGDVALNAPDNKAAIGARVREPASGLEISLRARWVEGFAVRSGVYAGTVPGYAVADLGARLPLPRRRLTATLALSNMFGREHREFVGAPRIGRLVLLRVRAEA